MRCLQHVLWRGAIALGLFVSGGAGVLALPQPTNSACNAPADLLLGTTQVRPQATWSANAEQPDPGQRNRC